MFSPLSLKSFLRRYGIALLIGGFFLVELSGLFYNFSLPETVGDETSIMTAALKMIAAHSWRPAFPTFYYYPLSAYLYLPFFVLLLLGLMVSGLYPTVGDLTYLGMVEYAKLLPLARLISIIFGAATLYLLYRICLALWDSRRISLIAAFLLGTNLLFFQIMHFGKVWSPQLFFLLLSFWYTVRMYKTGQPALRQYVLSAILIAVSFGINTVGIFIYLPFLVIHGFKNRGRGFVGSFILNRNFWVANSLIVLSVPVMYLLNPYGFDNYSMHTALIINGALHHGVGGYSGTVDVKQGIFFYPTILYEYGGPLLFIFLASIPIFFRRARVWFFAIGSFILGYYAFIGPLMGSVHHVEPRYILPVVPFMAVLAAYGLVGFYDGHFLSKKLKSILIFLLLASSLYPPLLWAHRLAAPSTRLLARDWVYENVPEGSRIINLDGYLPLNENQQSLADAQAYDRFAGKRQAYLLSLDPSRLPRPNYYVVADVGDAPADILRKGFDYALLIWWNKSEYAANRTYAESLGLKLKDPVALFPLGASAESDRMDIANNMRHPLRYLPAMRETGPVVAIYKLR